MRRSNALAGKTSPTRMSSAESAPYRITPSELNMNGDAILTFELLYLTRDACNAAVAKAHWQFYDD